MLRHPVLVLSVSFIAALFLTAPMAGAGDQRRGSEGASGASSLACCTLRSISSTFGCSADPQISGGPPQLSSICAVLYGLTGAFCGDSVVCGG
jgi:hypothetical protein